jgi:hypothetical protein
MTMDMDHEEAVDHAASIVAILTKHPLLVDMVFEINCNPEPYTNDESSILD